MPFSYNSPSGFSQQTRTTTRANTGGGGGLPSGGSNYSYVKSSDPIIAMAQETEAATQQANAANQARYDQIVGGYGGLYELGNQQYEALAGRTRGDYERLLEASGATIDQMGAQERADIARQAEVDNARVQQQLTERGMANSTILPTMQAGVTREKLAQEGRLNDRLAGMRLNALGQIGGAAIGADADLRDRMIQQGLGTGQAGLGFMERHEQNAEGLAGLADLAYKRASAGGDGGGGSGGYSRTIGGGKTKSNAKANIRPTAIPYGSGAAADIPSELRPAYARTY